MSETPPPPSTIEATPDIQHTNTTSTANSPTKSPTDPKKPKLSHVHQPGSSTASQIDHSSASETPAGPSSPSSSAGSPCGATLALAPPGVVENGLISPVVLAVQLPNEDEIAQDESEEWSDLKMSWSGKVYEMRVGANDMVYDFRAQIHSLTSVPPIRQKLIGLTKGKLSAELDSKRFGTLGVKKGVKFTMVGTPEEMSFKDPGEVKLPEIFDDFDVQYPTGVDAKKKGVAPADDPRNKRKIQEVIEKCPITVMNEPREGKGLLVLDLDYTIVDTKPLIAGSLPPAECARPGLHDFLELVYPHYDIVIWSQTHWRWLETKLVELDMIGGNRGYKICFVADRTSMFPVFTERNGQPYKHEVKPLAYFWAKYPQWSAKNSIHIDDLSRNFAMNPGEGLRIRAFNTAGQPDGYQDRELVKLGTYLVNLASRPDFTTVDHSLWKKSPLRRLAPVDVPPPSDLPDGTSER